MLRFAPIYSLTKFCTETKLTERLWEAVSQKHCTHTQQFVCAFFKACNYKIYYCESARLLPLIAAEEFNLSLFSEMAGDRLQWLISSMRRAHRDSWQLYLSSWSGYLAIIEWGWVGYEEFYRSGRVLSTEAEGRGWYHPPRSAEFFISYESRIQ